MQIPSAVLNALNRHASDAELRFIIQRFTEPGESVDDLLHYYREAYGCARVG